MVRLRIIAALKEVKNLTEDNNTEPVDQAGESGSDEDSALVKDLRKQVKDLSRELKAVPSRSDVEAEIRASVAREKAIESELTALKLPAGLSETVEGKLGDADVTREKVVEALTAIGFEITESPDGGESSADDGQETAQNLAGVANLGGEIAQAATQQTTDNLTDKINKARSTAEVAELMREAGLGQ